MATLSPTTVPGTTDDGQQTVTIIVAVAAGTLMILVISLCIIVLYLYSRRDRIAEKKTVAPPPVDNRHRLFREPTTSNSKFDDLLELEGMEGAIFQQDSSESPKKSKKKSKKAEVEVENENTRSNPTFGKDDIYAGALELYSRNRKPLPEPSAGEPSGVVNLAVDISDERASHSQSGDDEDHEESSQPVDGSDDPPLSPKLDILNPDTWKKVQEGDDTNAADGDVPDDDTDGGIPASGGGIPTTNGEVPGDDSSEKPALEDEDGGEGVFTISSAILDDRTDDDDDVTDDVIHDDVIQDDVIHNDVIQDDVIQDDGEEGNQPDDADTYYMYSPFQRTNSKRRRSFQTRNSAIIDFYEGGTLDRVHSTEDNTPRINSGIDMDTFWDGFRAPITETDSAQGLLWQKKRIF